MPYIKTSWRAAAGVAVVAGLLGGCDFIDPIESNPNQVPTATMDQLLTAAQSNTFAFAEGHLSRLTAMWTQQMAGTDRQFVGIDSFTFTDDEGDDFYIAMYIGGGLIDIRNGIVLAEAAGTDRSRVVAGILKIHEAYLLGMGASIWGDVVYTQALDPAQFPQPETDEQGSVYGAMQSLLDAAISDLNAGGSVALAADLVFGGDADAWIRVANSLKARFYLHTGELSSAIAAARNGISDPSENWVAPHNPNSAEDNPWWEFMIEQRSGYISAGKYLVDLLQDNDDPRLTIYYSQDPDEGYSGSPPAVSGAGTWSELGDAFGSQGADHAILSCAETQFIIAEAELRSGNTIPAIAALADGINCQEERFGITVPTYFPLDLEREIMTQKYIANFLNIEAWMDFRRTCLPDVRSTETAGGGRAVSGNVYPARLYYADDERLNNETIPESGAPGNSLLKADMDNLSGFWSTYNADCLQ